MEHLGQLHLGPEMGQVEAEETHDDKTQHQHVLGGPRISGGLAAHLVPLVASAGLDVAPTQPASVQDVDEKSQCQYGDHDVYDGSGHKVATELEQPVSCGEQLFVSGHNSEFAGERINHREEIDGAVKEQEDDQEGTADSLYKLLSDGRGEEIRHCV